MNYEKPEIFNLELENQLVDYFNKGCINGDTLYSLETKMDKTLSFVDYKDELKQVILERVLFVCKMKKDKYVPRFGQTDLKFHFFSTIMRNSTLGLLTGLNVYLDKNHSSHQNQVELNSRYWESLLMKAKREYNLKTLLQ